MQVYRTTCGVAKCFLLGYTFDRRLPRAITCARNDIIMTDMKQKDEEYWKKKLTPEQYHVLREKGTEPAFTGKLTNNFDTGMYECGACGQPLFSSDTKFDSECGWPSFDRSIQGNVILQEDSSFGMSRTEVMCSNCGSHLGHVFDDGPRETTGKRFCINSVSLNFKPAKK